MKQKQLITIAVVAVVAYLLFMKPQQQQSTNDPAVTRKRR